MASMSTPSGITRRVYENFTFTYPSMNWVQNARCAGEDIEQFFPSYFNERTRDIIRTFCHQCSVRLECLEYARATQSEGVWGGAFRSAMINGSRCRMTERGIS
jgi:hypothetical protein